MSQTPDADKKDLLLLRELNSSVHLLANEDAIEAAWREHRSRHPEDLPLGAEELAQASFALGWMNCVARVQIRLQQAVDDAASGRGIDLKQFPWHADD